ncbi:50S ribosomal protein L18e [Candidatus Pacearchaeota archaeon]|nr:50S ribosomal protein L18e [Candidatus Pacearchaeota archaeon]
MKSKTKIARQVKRKTNPEVVETVLNAKRNDGWREVAEILSSPRRIRIAVNLDKINKESKDGENVLIPGKVLSQGEISKKIKIIALNFSKTTEEKLLKTKTDFSRISDEIKKNPSAKGIKILR